MRSKRREFRLWKPRRKRLVNQLGWHLAVLREREWHDADEFTFVELSHFYSMLTDVANAIARGNERKAEDFIVAVEVEAYAIRGIA